MDIVISQRSENGVQNNVVNSSNGFTNKKSDIQTFFNGSTVFITGASGFLGKLLLEKLLWSCKDTKKIYILLRTKKDKDPEKRFHEIFDTVFFERLKRADPTFIEKVSYLSGDCCLPNLGLSDSELNTFKSEVDCIFHCAATVRFDEKLKTAAYINIRAVRDLLRISRDMKQLKAFVHVSTAYSNCPRKDIDETFYSLPITGEQILTLAETLEEAVLDKITPTLLGDWPNTYAFTKACAEDIIKKEGQGLPVAVVRPSIVLATSTEPVAGWIDNLYGATGVLLGAATGLIRSLHCNERNMADMVPADHVINTSIAAAWDIATAKKITKKDESTTENTDSESEIPIYNYVSSPEKPITWHEYMTFAYKHCNAIPSPMVLWHYFFNMTPSKRFHQFTVLFLHYLPAYIVDFIARCIGKKPMLVNGYKKIDKFSDVISYFSTREWNFTNHNTQSLWKRLDARDKQMFYFDMASFDWDVYFYSYARGCRVYLLKDPLETIPEGRTKLKRLRIAHYCLMTLLAFILFKMCCFILQLFG